jgi:hypothetical protein
MTVLAEIRPDSWDVPLFLHITGAMVLVGGVLSAACALAIGRGDERMVALGQRALLAVALPGYIVMRVAAEWLADKEGYNAKGAAQPDWLGIGYSVADGGLALLVIALVCGGIGLRRMRGGRGGTGLITTTTVISILLLVAYTVAVWAMSGKPGG